LVFRHMFLESSYSMLPLVSVQNKSVAEKSKMAANMAAETQDALYIDN